MIHYGTVVFLLKKLSPAILFGLLLGLSLPAQTTLLFLFIALLARRNLMPNRRAQA